MVDQDEGLGGCALVVDEKNEILCNHPGEVEILVRNKFGLFAVVLCTAHKVAHRKFYEKLAKTRRRRTERVPPNQGDDSGELHAEVESADSAGKELHFMPPVPV